MIPEINSDARGAARQEHRDMQGEYRAGHAPARCFLIQRFRSRTPLPHSDAAPEAFLRWPFSCKIRVRQMSPSVIYDEVPVLMLRGHGGCCARSVPRESVHSGGRTGAGWQRDEWLLREGE